MIVFYSRADENYVNGQLRQLTVGNTELAAGTIQELTGADSFHLEQRVPYAKTYNQCIAQAQEDQQRNARPELKSCPESLEAYDVIWLGYPNYWSTMPMAVFTFLEGFDFSGKEIRPFCTHEGSGLGSSISDLKKLCPTATIREGLAIQGGCVAQSRSKIEKWVSKLTQS